jgi:hypothetical protein
MAGARLPQSFVSGKRLEDIRLGEGEPGFLVGVVEGYHEVFDLQLSVGVLSAWTH